MSSLPTEWTDENRERWVRERLQREAGRIRFNVELSELAMLVRRIDEARTPTPVFDADLQNYRSASGEEAFAKYQIVHELRAILDYAEREYGKSQQGYFSGQGFGARALRALVNELEKP